jgi:hypothetical protein
MFINVFYSLDSINVLNYLYLMFLEGMNELISIGLAGISFQIDNTTFSFIDS